MTAVVFAPKKPVDVRATLAKTPIRGSKGLRPGECYAEFWLQPEVYLNGRWQGGESIQVRRDGANEFKIGTIPVMTLEQAAKYIEEMLDRYNWPYLGSQPWEHPFVYNI